MLSKGFKIVSPKRFEIDIEALENKENYTIIKLEHAAICKADLRYYLGQREEKILGLKYPMRLIHEATGIILKDPTGKFEVGDSVVLVPNICDCEVCDFKYVDDNTLGVNYCPKAKFASSNYDGFSCECISFPTNNIVKYDRDKINSNIAVFGELISVCIAALRRVENIDGKKVAIWGDGILGYIMAHTIRELYNKVEVICIGKNKSKLKKFDVDNMYITNEIEKELEVDLAIECIGGNYAEIGINEMIEHVKFGGDIILTGVSEVGAHINTRRILEKAIRITGSTRSSIDDFRKSVEILKNDGYQKKIEELILSENIVSDIASYYAVFEAESRNRELGKNLIKFNL